MGLKVIELIEADRRPEQVTPERWAEYKTKWLPQVYHSLGLIAFASNNTAEAQARLDKAAALNSSDPMTYVFLGAIANQKYEQLKGQYDAASGGAKDPLLKQALTQMDQVIESWAHAVALAEADTRYEQLRAQLSQDLESYYKYRKGSTQGLRELIDKYKKPAGTTPQ